MNCASLRIQINREFTGNCILPDTSPARKENDLRQNNARAHFVERWVAMGFVRICRSIPYPDKDILSDLICVHPCQSAVKSSFQFGVAKFQQLASLLTCPSCKQKFANNR
jgi:hypothetical protein